MFFFYLLKKARMFECPTMKFIVKLAWMTLQVERVNIRSDLTISFKLITARDIQRVYLVSFNKFTSNFTKTDSSTFIIKSTLVTLLVNTCHEVLTRENVGNFDEVETWMLENSNFISEWSLRENYSRSLNRASMSLFYIATRYHVKVSAYSTAWKLKRNSRAK